jgi:pimeloyl-ACP methyl ester carboxylesterase
VRATIRGLLDIAAHRSIIIDEFKVDDHWLPFILHNELDNVHLNQTLADIVREIADDATGPPGHAHSQQLKAMLTALRDGEDSALAEITCGDAAAPADPAWYWEKIQATRATEPVFGALAENIQPCAFWPQPVEPLTRVRNSVPALILQATGDPRTPYEYATRLHRDMSASRLVTLQDVRIHMTFRPGLSTCVDDSINSYLAGGDLPARDVVCHADKATQ